MPRATLFDHLTPPASSAPQRIPLRIRRHPCAQFVRYPGKGSRFQVRWWLGGYGSINCGLYDSEDTAEMVRGALVRESGRHPATPLGLWAALGVVLAGMRRRFPEAQWPRVLPMWAKLTPAGFVGRVRKGGRLLECGPFDSPQEAHHGMAEMLGREFPRPVEAEPAGRRAVVTLADYLATA